MIQIRAFAVAALFLLSGATNTFAQNDGGVYVIPEGHELYGMVSHISTSSDGPIIRQEYVYTEEATNSSGRLSLVYTYSGDTIISARTRFSADYTATWGVRELLQTLDQEGNRTSLVYSLYDSSEWEFSDDDLDTIMYYPPRLSSYYNEAFYEETPNVQGSRVHIMNPPEPASSLVYFADSEVFDLSEEEAFFFASLAEHMPDFNAGSPKRITVSENGERSTFYIPDTFIEGGITDLESALAYFFFLGVSKDGPVNLVVDLKTQ